MWPKLGVCFEKSELKKKKDSCCQDIMHKIIKEMVLFTLVFISIYLAL